MTKHTPGPWNIREIDGRALIDGQRGFVCTLDQPPGPEQQANARLIAAAPDLLGALKAFMADYDNPMQICMNGYTAEKARAAIAKAEGCP